MKRFVLILNSIVPIFAALLLQSLVYLIITMLYTLFSGGSEPQSITEHYITIAAAAACGVACIFWYRADRSGRPKTIRSKLLSVMNVILLGLLGIGTQFLISGTMSLIRPYTEKMFTDYAEVVDSIVTGNQFIVLLYIIIIAPITEELIFRGMILGRALPGMTFMGANLLQAAVFGIYHGNLLQGGFTFAVGLLLGLVYHKYQTLLAPILLHMVTNAASYLIGIFPDDQPMAIIITAVGGFILTVCFWIIFRKKIEPDF